MMQTRQLLLLVGLCLTLFTASATDSGQRLRFDPFNRPDLETLPKPIEVRVEKQEEELPEVWEAHLHATMRSGLHSFANVDGNIIAIGESIEGYRLIEVYERSAVFTKKGKRFTLNLDGTENEDNERNLSVVE